ncbi:MAG: exopolyphosphatase [Comamonadaceae bacterium CG1_02_60_18]|nr:MAG: exopolyphosphatase [Comamonadaceae bacterium CG1_02_60_18]PIQ53653.1 MAG: exopolyphosphatase [Comamonadaceae bacterium CG12_big_fil_rev_8_21_14_0_65_59_15]
MENTTFLAAVDLGSNSFRMEIGRFDHGQLQRVDYLKETVRLGNGFDEERNLSDAAMRRGWDCLARFAERIHGFEAGQVRAVATQTLREARNRDRFIARGNDLLGFPIEVIAGTEEARLIYQGVQHWLPPGDERRLVIDIGGRSTELVLGAGPQVLRTSSSRVGSVAWSMKYFANGEFTESALRRAEIAAQAVLEEALTTHGHDQWEQAYGASGTVGAVADILGAAGRSTDRINRDDLNWLVKTLLRAGNTSKVQLAGLRDDRRAVLGGGLSVLRGLMELLRIDELQVAQGALRHGLLLEMAERQDHDSDARDVSVQRLAQKFAVDREQAQRVSRVATQLHVQLDSASNPRRGELQRKLQWAAQLHEIGIAISSSDYHKHGAYILENADVVGFTLPELQRLGLLVLGHRGKLKKLDADFAAPDFVKMLLALRLAVILCHARRDPQHQGLELKCNAQYQRFFLGVDKDWLQRFPQSAHLLRQESQSWLKTAWTFELMER